MTQPDIETLMIAKGRRFLVSAELPRSHGDYDSAVSRLYYAMFYGAQALLHERGVFFSKHQAVISAFGQYFAKTELVSPDLHAWLRNAFDSRQASDYQFHRTTLEADVLDL